MGVKASFRGKRGQQIILLSAAMALTLIGCVSQQAQQRDFDAAYTAGGYEKSVGIAMQGLGKQVDDLVDADLLWVLQAASANRAEGHLRESNLLLEKGEETLKQWGEESLAGDAAGSVARHVVNDRAAGYRGEIYDGVMVNTYKAINDMALGDWLNARIELSRADDRQRRAVEVYGAEIARLEGELAQESDATRGKVTKAINNPELAKIIAEHYPEMDRWAAYPDFVNPFATYVHGLFYLLDAKGRDDLEKARASFERVAGMNPGQAAVAEDLLLADALLHGSTRREELPPRVWVIFENGLGPCLEELHVRVPVMLPRMKYFGIALPKFVERKRAFEHLAIYSGDCRLAETTLLASMDQVVAKEFSQDFPIILKRAMVSAVMKGTVQFNASLFGGSIGTLLGGAYQAVTTRADLRIWSALPKEFQVARFLKPVAGGVRIVDPGTGRTIAELRLPAAPFVVVYVSIPVAVAPAATSVMAFGCNGALFCEVH